MDKSTAAHRSVAISEAIKVAQKYGLPVYVIDSFRPMMKELAQYDLAMPDTSTNEDQWLINLSMHHIYHKCTEKISPAFFVVQKENPDNVPCYMNIFAYLENEKVVHALAFIAIGGGGYDHAQVEGMKGTKTYDDIRNWQVNAVNGIFACSPILLNTKVTYKTPTKIRVIEESRCTTAERKKRSRELIKFFEMTRLEYQKDTQEKEDTARKLREQMPHFRRAHFRTLRTGKTIPVSSCKIHADRFTEPLVNVYV